MTEPSDSVEVQDIDGHALEARLPEGQHRAGLVRLTGGYYLTPSAAAELGAALVKLAALAERKEPGA